MFLNSPNTNFEPMTAEQGGFSLIELMVSITISLLLLAGLVTVVMNTNQSFGEITKSGRQLENGRYAIQVIKESMQHAGFYGELTDLGTVSGTLPDPCSVTVANLEAALALPIQGYNAVSGTPPSPLSTCLNDANHLDGTDILVIRRALTNTTALGSLEQGKVYIQSRSNSFVMAAEDADGTNDAITFDLLKKDATTAADTREYRVEIYYVSPCNEPVGTDCNAAADDGNPIPTLKRMVLSTNGTLTAFVTEPLVEGIENFQIEYGIDRSGDGIPNESAGGANDEYIVSPADTTTWSNVMSVRVFLLSRNTEITAGYTDSKTYSLGLAGSVSPGGNYKRHLFSAVMRAVNPAGRRES